MAPTPRQHPEDWNAKLLNFFLGNTRLVWLLIAALLVGGTISLLSLRREGFPQVPVKIVLVQTVWPGATPQEVENHVTKEIEAAVQDVKGLKSTSSTSANSFSNVVVSLDESVSTDSAVQDVQSKVVGVRSLLPTDAEAPKVQTFSTGGASFIYGVTDDSQRISQIQAEAQRVADALADLPSIKSARLLHDAPDRIVIAFRSADLTANAISLQTLQLILQGANVNFPAGQLDIDERQQSVVSIGALTSIDELKKLIVGVHPQTGQPVLLTDIADVRVASSDPDFISRFGYHRQGKLVTTIGALVGVDIAPDADIIRARHDIEKRLDQARLDGAITAGIAVVPLSDQAAATQNQIDEILGGAIGTRGNLYLLGGMQLLFLSMLIFVNWRAALVAALSIPLSLLFTFLSLWLTGTQLNTIVLFSMILVLGLIVDPAIVMVEAVQRFRDLRVGPWEAAKQSGRRYGASLFMAVLTSVIVFVPFGVVSGIFGEIIAYIPLTVIPALVASYLVPIGLLPLLSTRLLITPRHVRHQTGTGHEVEGLSAAAEWVMRLNRSILAKRWKQIVTLILSVVLIGASFTLVATGRVQSVQFSTPEDNDALAVDASFGPGLTFTGRESIAKAIEARLLDEPGIKHFYYFDQSRSGLYLFVELYPKAERNEDNRSKQIVARLRQSMQHLPQLQDVQVNEVTTGPPQAAYQIQIQLNDNDAAVLERAAKDVGAFLAKQPKVVKVDDGYSRRTEAEVHIVLDRAKVQSAGLSSIAIGQQLKAVIGETEVTKFTAADQTRRDIVLKAATAPKDLNAIRDLLLINQVGQSVRIRDVATVDEGTSVDAIQRFDQQRYVNVRARVKGNNSDVFVVQRSLNDYLTDARKKAWGLDSTGSRGEFDDIAKSFRELGVALAAAIVLTYIVLVLQFKSFSQPVVMLVTVPLSLVGVFPALWLTGSELGFLELLGVTILVGIVENVAIFLIDYANQLVHEQSLDPKEAIIRSSGVRFRPILLTKLVALGGLLPLAIESEFWRGLAVTIMAGIGLSGFLSLIVIPILYVWIEQGRRRFHRRLAHTSQT